MDGFAAARVGRDLSVTHGDDAGLYVKFVREAVQNQYNSEQAGRPMFDEFDFCEIHVPGGKTMVKHRVTEEDKQRFPRQWANYLEFREGKTGEKLIGTPLSEWPAVGVSQIAEWNALKIFTVDQLANLTDQGLQYIGLGAREWRAKAQAYLSSASEKANEVALAAENERMANEVIGLQQQVKDLAAQMQAMQTQRAQPAPMVIPVTSTNTFDTDMSWANQNRVDTPSVLKFQAPENLVDEPTIELPDRPRRGRPPNALKG